MYVYIFMRRWISKNEGRKEKNREVFGGGMLPSDIVCLIAIQGGPVGYVRACRQKDANVPHGVLFCESQQGKPDHEADRVEGYYGRSKSVYCRGFLVACKLIQSLFFFGRGGGFRGKLTITHARGYQDGNDSVIVWLCDVLIGTSDRYKKGFGMGDLPVLQEGQLCSH